MKNRLNDAAVCSDVGNVRQENQDNFYLDGIFDSDKNESFISKRISFKKNALFAVADGMGGQSFGSYASLRAVSLLRDYFFKSNFKLDSRIEEYIDAANNDICSYAAKTATMIGTTLVVLSIENERARVYNIGDSRCYLYRKGKLLQLSKDHTLAAELAAMKVLSAEEAENDSRKHQLTQHIGISQEEMLLSVYRSPEITLKSGDRLLLCSDGVTDALNNGEIAGILSGKGRSKRVANDIVFKALDNNAGDNVTALVVSIVDTAKEKRIRNLIWGGLLLLAAAAGIVTGLLLN